MRTNEIIGFRAFHHDTQRHLHHDPVTNQNFLDISEPVPAPRADIHRRIAAFIEQPGQENMDDFSIDPVYRETTPVENVASELGDLLQSLCSRHGLDLGLSQEQIRAKIQEELTGFGAYTPDVVAAIRR